MRAPPRTPAAWIAVDWGSSNLRAWAMADDEQVLARTGSDRGMLSLTPTDYEAALLEVIGDWLPAEGHVPVRVCGMAGARADLASGETVTLVGAEALCTRYALALAALGIDCRLVDGEAATLAGLGLAHATLA